MSNIHQEMLDVLFAKYRHSPNILGVLEILASPLQDSNDAIDYILDHLSIDTAEGEILDFLGELIGVTRSPAQEEDVFCLCRDEEIADDPENHHGLATDGLAEGGFLTGDDGLVSKSVPGTYVSDAVFRAYIRAKAATFRKIATRETIYDYILQFGIRAKIIEGERDVQIEPSHYADLDYAIRSHLTNRGFRPAGIQVRIKQQTTSDSEV